jgi:flagellar motor switch protein FliG
MLDQATDRIAQDVRKRLKKIGTGADDSDPWPALGVASGIIAKLPETLRRQVLTRLPEEIRQEVVQRLYSFDTLHGQSDRTLQELITSIDRRTLATALIGAEEATYDAVTRNMSRRAATMLTEDVESLVRAGELSTRDVQQAREMVGRALLSNEESGQIWR